ncbi:PadR family transcriptional regulator [Sesbania bispinosa]|nr:PadR family transcriptional regulator [Sesbania bispinosa]
MTGETEGVRSHTSFPERVQNQQELCLLRTLETPVATFGGLEGIPRAVIPAAVLSDLVTNQQNLANLVTNLNAQVRAEGMTRRANDTQSHQEIVKEVHDESPDRKRWGASDELLGRPQNT